MIPSHDPSPKRTLLPVGGSSSGSGHGSPPCQGADDGEDRLAPATGAETELVGGKFVHGCGSLSLIPGFLHPFRVRRFADRIGSVDQKGLPWLEELSIVATRVTEEEAAAFRKAVPGCSIRWSYDDLNNAMINQQYNLSAALNEFGARVLQAPNGDIIEVDMGRRNRKITDSGLNTGRPRGALPLRRLEETCRHHGCRSGRSSRAQEPGKPECGLDEDHRLRGWCISEELHPTRAMTLGHTAITDKGVESLKKMEKLEYLILAGTKVTGVGIEQLKQRLFLAATSCSDQDTSARVAGSMRQRDPTFPVSPAAIVPSTLNPGSPPANHPGSRFLDPVAEDRQCWTGSRKRQNAVSGTVGDAVGDEVSSTVMQRVKLGIREVTRALERPIGHVGGDGEDRLSHPGEIELEFTLPPRIIVHLHRESSAHDEAFQAVMANNADNRTFCIVASLLHVRPIELLHG